jgi:hypothetical protein
MPELVEQRAQTYGNKDQNRRGGAYYIKPSLLISFINKLLGGRKRVSRPGLTGSWITKRKKGGSR